MNDGFTNIFMNQENRIYTLFKNLVDSNIISKAMRKSIKQTRLDKVLGNDFA